METCFACLVSGMGALAPGWDAAEFAGTAVECTAAEGTVEAAVDAVSMQVARSADSAVQHTGQD